MVNVTKKETSFFVIMLLTLIVLAINFDNFLGYLFAIILIGGALMGIFDINKSTRFPISKGNVKRSLTVAILGLVAVYIISPFILLLFGYGKFGTLSVISLFAQQNLIFTGSVILALVSLGFVVAPIETNLLSRIMDYLRDRWGTGLDKISVNYLLMLLISTLFFVVLHFNAKGLSGESLIPVGVFFAISFVMIGYEKEQLSAIFMHVINNTIAVWYTYKESFINLGLSSPFILGGIVLAGLFFLFRFKVLQKPIGG